MCGFILIAITSHIITDTNQYIFRLLEFVFIKLLFSVFVFIDRGLMQKKIFPHHNYFIIHVCRQLSIYTSKIEFQDNFTGPLGMYYIIKSLIVWGEYKQTYHMYKCSSTTCSDHIDELLVNGWNFMTFCSPVVLLVKTKFPDFSLIFS